MKGKFKEKVIFARLKGKDREAFTEAYDLYIDKIYRFVYFKIGDAHEAEDLTSAVFLKTWNYVIENSLTDHKTLPALFYKIARNSIIDYYRTNNRQDRLSLTGEDGPIEVADEKQNIGRQAELASDLKIVEDKLLELKDEYREVIILRFIDELSIGEIAEILDKPRGNVRILIFRALKALRELLG